ncbi:MAG: 16S rRNA (guanine(966)-N(2))-methyltransferase RsmD [Dehalococcoidia bacterium]
MRVIAGSARGIELRAPRGRGTRPTAGRLREALFSMLEAAGVDFTDTLDLYAGSGALGIEALSRGAERCTFVESDARACEALRANLERTGFTDHARVERRQVERWRASGDGAHTLVLADPPYHDATSWSAIERALTGALADAATVVVEHSAREAPPASLAGRSLWRDRRQGEGAVAVYRSGTATERGESG